MTYGKEYRILKNFQEYDEESNFEDELIKLCKKSKAVLFIENKEVELK